MVTFVLFLCGLMVMGRCMTHLDEFFEEKVDGIKFTINIVIDLIVFSLILIAITIS